MSTNAGAPAPWATARLAWRSASGSSARSKLSVAVARILAGDGHDGLGVRWALASLTGSAFAGASTGTEGSSTLSTAKDGLWEV